MLVLLWLYFIGSRIFLISSIALFTFTNKPIPFVISIFIILIEHRILNQSVDEYLKQKYGKGNKNVNS